MKTTRTKSRVSNTTVDPEEQGLSITLGRFDFCPYGTVIDNRTGASLGRIQFMRTTTTNAHELEALSAWRSWLAAPLPARSRRAA